MAKKNQIINNDTSAGSRSFNRFEMQVSQVLHLIIADNEEELEKQLTVPKERIAVLVDAAGKVRNRIQELQTTLQQHEYQLMTIRDYQTKKTSDVPDRKSLHTCPRSYVFIRSFDIGLRQSKGTQYDFLLFGYGVIQFILPFISPHHFNLFTRWCLSP